MAILTPMRAIRQKCLECSAGATKEVRECPVKKCALYVYRNGHRPKGEEDTAEDISEENSQDTAVVFEKEDKHDGSYNGYIERS